jgi:hypothetical protein
MPLWQIRTLVRDKKTNFKENVKNKNKNEKRLRLELKRALKL